MHRKPDDHKRELLTPHVGKADAGCGKGRRALWERPTLAVGKADACCGVWDCSIRKAGQPALGHPASIGFIVQGITYFTRIFLPPRM